MDFQTISNNIKRGIYKTKEAFQEDVWLVFSNAKSYNQAGTVFHKYAVQIGEFAEQLLSRLSEGETSQQKRRGKAQ